MLELQCKDIASDPLAQSVIAERLRFYAAA